MISPDFLKILLGIIPKELRLKMIQRDDCLYIRVNSAANVDVTDTKICYWLV